MTEHAPLNLLTCGTFDDSIRKKVIAKLDSWRPHITALLHPTGEGADQTITEWASANKIPSKPFSGREEDGIVWRIRRNHRIFEQGPPHAVIILPGGIYADQVRLLAKTYNATVTDLNHS